jgi:RNA polymerase sigma factor (sigma-70 family)
MREYEAETGDLATRARQGDVDAFTRLVRSYQSMAFGYAFSRLGDFDLAEDAAQQAFVTAYRSLDKLRQPERFGGWLRSIVYFECSHIRRARSFSHLPLDSADQVAESLDPHERVEKDEGFSRLFDAIRALPQAQRETTILYYLHDHSQGEVAAFLGIPVSTVNNRLRTARKSLREELLAMADNAFSEQRLPDSFASRIGAIVRAEGTMIEARFDPGQRPRVLNALTVTGEGSDPVTTIEAIQLIGEDLVRCIPVTPGAARIDTGMRVIDTGGPISIPLQPDAIRGVMSSFEMASPSESFMETGIKILDLMVPLPRRGRIAFAGDMHSGKMVLVDELIHRLANTDAELTIYVFVQTPDEAAAINALEYRASRNVAAIYLPVADASPEALVELTAGLDTVITFNSELGRQQIWPAVDPLQSRSRLLDQQVVAKDHQQVAARVREALGNENNGRRIQEFFAQLFFVAEPYTGKEGTSFELEETLRDALAIIEDDGSGI